MREQGITLPPQMVRAKAKEISQIMSIDFADSNHWYDKFIKRFGLRSINLYGEGGKNDRSFPKLQQELESFYDELSSL